MGLGNELSPGGASFCFVFPKIRGRFRPLFGYLRADTDVNCARTGGRCRRTADIADHCLERLSWAETGPTSCRLRKDRSWRQSRPCQREAAGHGSGVVHRPRPSASRSYSTARLLTEPRYALMSIWGRAWAAGAGNAVKRTFTPTARANPLHRDGASGISDMTTLATRKRTIHIICNRHWEVDLRSNSQRFRVSNRLIRRSGIPLVGGCQEPKCEAAVR